MYSYPLALGRLPYDKLCLSDMCISGNILRTAYDVDPSDDDAFAV